MTRFIFITGGVVSSLGKGIAAASLGACLQARGFKIRIRKLDPYINLDPGTMNPLEHGEVYVTEDGAETDLDLGHYERVTGVSSRQSDNITTGRIYSSVIEKERKGEYLGKTVQVIPHITDEIKTFIGNDLTDEDFCLVEIGGTVGDIESLPFLEAIRQFSNENDKGKCLFIHLTLIPYLQSAQELKTKPTQHSVKELQSLGIMPNILLCRCEQPIPDKEREKIALFCNVEKSHVIPAYDVKKSIYEVPLEYHNKGLDIQVLKHFQLQEVQPDLEKWKNIVQRYNHPKEKINVGIVGKYVQYTESYKSISEALVHGGLFHQVQINIVWIDSQKLEKQNHINGLLDPLHAILIPGGFGERGAEGKMIAAHWARTQKVPFFGICFGMQMAVLEIARNILGLKEASSSEFQECQNPIIGLMTEWKTKAGNVTHRSKNDHLGGTMRLGNYECLLDQNSQVRQIYGKDMIAERHRHRYEVNINYRDQLEAVGLRFVGMSPDQNLPEIIEYEDHPWFIGVQFHPELKSRPFDVHPLFQSFIQAAINYKKSTA